MALNDAYLAKMQREIAAAKDGQAVAEQVQVDAIASEQANEPAIEQKAEASFSQTQDKNAELEALRSEFEAYKASKVEQPSGELKEQAKEDEIDFYDTPEERQNLIDQWGEDEVKSREKFFAKAVQAAQKMNQPKISELEKRNLQLEQTHQSAEFTRAVGSDSLKVFNDPTFQAIAKGTETGYKRTLYDDLKAIVEGSDVEGAEYLRSQVEKYNTGKTAVRKAQVNSGRSPTTSQQETAVYDQRKADKLITEMQRHRVGTDAFNQAKAKVDKHLALATH